MKHCFLGCLLLAFATDGWAHRLDEYLQATRVAVSTDRVEVSVDLTPGVAIAQQLLGVIDKNRDGQISKEEIATYARQVLKDIQVRLDEKSLTLSLVDVSFPALKEIEGGLGVIRIKATAPVGPLDAGSHRLHLTNTHLPAISVYLVNALVPKNAAIKITKQSRDELQKSYRLDFDVALPTLQR